MSILNSIKSVNERGAEIRRVYGESSRAYKEFERAIYENIPEDLIGKSKSGTIKIRQGKGAIGALNEDILNDIKDEFRTSGQYRKDLEKSYKEEYGDGKPTKHDIQEYDKMRTTVQEAAENGKLKDYLSGQGGRGRRGKKMTYSELFAIIEKESIENEEEAQKDVAEYARSRTK